MSLLHLNSAVGAVLSIQSTVIVFLPIFPKSSINSNSILSLSKKVIVLLLSTGFSATWTSFDSIVTFLSNFKVATTSSLVISVVLNVTSTVGAVLSIHVTLAVVDPLLPSLSTYSNVNSPFSVNV